MSKVLDSKLGKGLTDTLLDKGALDLAADLGEAILGEQLSDGILKNIPYIGCAMKLFKIREGVADRILLKKILKFFGPLAEIPAKEREEFAKKLNDDPKLRSTVGEHLMVLVDRVDDMDKPEILSWLFQQVVIDRLSYSKFREMSMAIDRCFLDDLIFLDDVKHGSNNYLPEVASRLLGCGLLEIVSIPQVKGPGAANRYGLTGMGKNLAVLYKEYLDRPVA